MGWERSETYWYDDDGEEYFYLDVYDYNSGDWYWWDTEDDADNCYYYNWPANLDTDVATYLDENLVYDYSGEAWFDDSGEEYDVFCIDWEEGDEVYTDCYYFDYDGYLWFLETSGWFEDEDDDVVIVEILIYEEAEWSEEDFTDGLDSCILYEDEDEDDDDDDEDDSAIGLSTFVSLIITFFTLY